MIESIITSLTPSFDRLDWVDLYGGLVETWTRKGKAADTETAETFPVTWGTPQNCDAGCLGKLLPNQKKKNISFWTIETDAVLSTPTNISRALRPTQYTQNARLTVWLNFSGCDSCDPSSYVAYFEYLKQLFNGKKFSLTAPVSLKGSIKVLGMANKDYREVFNRWTFGQEERFFVFPFDFFAMDCTFTWIQNQSCPIIPTC